MVGNRLHWSRVSATAIVTAFALLAPVATSSAVAADLVVSQGSEPLSFDPTQFATGNHVFLHQLYDALVVVGPDGSPQPALAESWERSDDGLTVRFTLRQGAKFHSGRAITADDVAFTIKRYLTEEVGANLMERMESFTGVKVIDPQTFEISLSSPTPGLFDLLSAVFVQDSEAIANIAKSDAGSGPYQLSAFEPGVSFVMTKVPGHWRASESGPDSIIVKILPDEGSAAAALQAGQVDLMLQASAQAAANLDGVAGIEVVRSDAAPISYYLMANTERGALASQEVRLALQRAIDRQAIADIVYSGAAVPTCQPWSASHWAHDAALEDDCSFDIDAARSHLAASGETGVTLTVNTAIDSYSPGSSATAQILQQSLAEIGVTLNIVTYEQAQARQLLLASDFDLLLHQYNEGGNDPQFIMPSGLYGPNGRAKFTSPEYEALIAKAGSTLDLEARKVIYSDISKLIIGSAFIMPIAHGVRTLPMREGVQGVRLDASGFPVLTDVVLP
jgi:peptide/nickel transport system substrate-binding protein